MLGRAQSYNSSHTQPPPPPGYGYGQSLQHSQSYRGPPPGADPQLWQWFSAVDTDRSGNWTNFDLDTVKMLMGIFDTDRSGTIGFNEFAGLWKYVSDWQGVFRHFDVDRSGSIDGHELANALRSFGYNLTPEILMLVEQKYATPPATNYGPPPGITFDRFVRACIVVKTLTESFRRMDSDGDGWIQVNYEQFMRRTQAGETPFRVVDDALSSCLPTIISCLAQSCDPPTLLRLMYSPLRIEWPENVDITKQGVEVPGTRRPGQTGHYRNGVWGLTMLESQPYVRTLPDIFELGLKLSKNDPFLGYRPVLSTNPLKYVGHFVWSTYAQVDVRRRNIGSALHKLFTDGVLGGGELDTVGIWSQNRPEWQIIDLALHAYAKIGHANLSVVFVSAQHIPTLLALRQRIPVLRMIVSIDDLTAEVSRILTSWGSIANIQIKELRELEEFGKANNIPPIPATPEQIATICYTSGTLSTPKGAILTHGNLTFSVVTNLHGGLYDDKGVLLSYLPLAHIYERVNELNILCYGGKIGYFTGDPLRLLEDATILRPNYFPSVPRVLNRVYQIAMLAAQAPGLKGFLFRSAVEAKIKRLRETGDNKHAFWDKLVFRKVQAVLGGNIMLLTTGSAPISVQAMDFLKIAFSCDVVEGYGMTETCTTGCRTWPNDPDSSGLIGGPHPCNEVKLVDVPSLNYTSNDKPHPRGEICMRGGNCLKAYYKDEKSTRETVDEEGWMHTGDVGEVDSFGRFKVIDRVKNIMKLSQGEYAALERIENAYLMNPLLAQLYVHGDSLQDYLVGIVVPEPAKFASLVSEVGGVHVAPEDFGALAKAIRDPRIVQAVSDEMLKEAKKAELKGFEIIKKIHITLDPFTPDNELLTPTFKIRRRDVQAKYKKELEAMYANPLASVLSQQVKL
ncbi:hypothetical protein EW145_g3864 [Phellinidium pouzarii]|uniref:EF-hand domain-containing protein n=1 Tax=Phellinidium pouzarii TaxID=167371 RepID=A0A4S4L706_9AGAM|nr:hypothetical protein EW145_g3864 [Phellinidium pouzarii]